ncbi:MAG: cobamide remodeling phosphodiesterase CbiR [Elusimicrobiota bacterium]
MSFNYRIGTTSYIYPESMLENIRKLKNKVDDIELLFFEQGYSPGKDELDAMKQSSEKDGFSYTVHLPLDLELGSSEEAVRRQAVDEVRRIIKEVFFLEPYAYILHINKTDDLEWEKNIRCSLQSIVKDISISPDKICVENLEYPLELIEKIINEFGFSICLDIGHMIENKYDIKRYFNRYINKTRVIHLYEIDGKGRHGSLNKVDSEIISWLKDMLAFIKYDGLITLEVFSEEDFIESLAILTGRNNIRPVVEEKERYSRLAE